ncbi:hypothetical protein WOLCODRAFT_161136 [Wolfiporia cocos MD-104 SS10]|uniref:Protection of telomeres protein 1 ssDNA-binding domain-containing protein n=1 Tax=Wolfiporia cocos (strain MD-104) TaxID=742152 RepID=A0A2H3JPF2_WOLCO|nr:hypothetical protein WOLCODRAFT_161136 [Wolfiporia cocos MD-104 SS10]
MLPKPDLHQVLALRYIQGDEFNGESCGSAPSYKDWHAAIFDPRTDAIVSRPSEADTDELLFEPTSSELVLCKRLKEWWATTEAYINPVTVHSVSGDHVPKRIHRLISDVHPDVEPHGFFDCTVEVLYQHESNSGIHTVYLTDYTANPSLGVIERDWTPPQLNNKVMKMELFGDAAAEGANMNPGDYYEFRNAKMRISRGGYWEAKFDDRVDRMQKLSTDELEHYPHLSALLRRKKEWQEQVEACGDEQHFPHALFEQFTRNHHYNCTVEVLSVSANEADPVFLYVTDYTPRNDLVPVDTTHGHWSSLQDRIVKIKLIDEQAKTGKNLQPGDFDTWAAHSDCYANS